MSLDRESYLVYAIDNKVRNVRRWVVRFQWLTYDDVLSYDEAENRPDQVLNLVVECGGLGGCAAMYYTRVNFCIVLR